MTRSMAKLLAEIGALSASEKTELLRTVARDLTAGPERGSAGTYRDAPPADDEFSAEADSLAWEADGWENVG